MRNRADRFIHSAYALLSITAAVALATFAWRGWYARYLTDDYCTSSLIRDLGFFEAMAHHREHWSGRFSYFPLKGLLKLIGPVTAQVTPLLLILLLLGATLWSLHVVAPFSSRTARLALGFAFVLAYIAGAPSLTNIGGALYWETGSVTYTTPLILFVLWAALFAARIPAWSAVALSAALMFVAGGLSETSLAAQGALTGTALLVAIAARDLRATRIAASGLVASIAALAVVASAPGNAVRAQVDVVAHTPLETVVRCFSLANDFIGTYVFAGGLPLLPLIAVALALGSSLPTVSRGWIWAVAGASTAAYIVSFLPAALLLNAGPPERALDVPNFFAMAVIAAVAFRAGARISSERGFVFAAVLIGASLIPIAVLRANLESIPHARFIAAQMDRTDALLRQSEGKHVTLRAPWAVQQRIFDGDPKHWSNVCVSRFYRLQSFHATR
jgi:hypothetical protein